MGRSTRDAIIARHHTVRTRTFKGLLADRAHFVSKIVHPGAYALPLYNFQLHPPFKSIIQQSEIPLLKTYYWSFFSRRMEANAQQHPSAVKRSLCSHTLSPFWPSTSFFLLVLWMLAWCCWMKRRLSSSLLLNTLSMYFLTEKLFSTSVISLRLENIRYLHLFDLRSLNFEGLRSLLGFLRKEEETPSLLQNQGETGHKFLQLLILLGGDVNREQGAGPGPAQVLQKIVLCFISPRTLGVYLCMSFLTSSPSRNKIYYLLGQLDSRGNRTSPKNFRDSLVLGCLSLQEKIP